MFTTKICGITRLADAEIVLNSAADAIGLNFYSKSRRFIDRNTATAICGLVGSRLLRVGVFVNDDVESILETVEQTGIDAVQLHGDEPVEILQELKSVPVIRAFRCKDGELSEVSDFLRQAEDQGTPPAGILLDAYHPGEYGGTGLMLDPIGLAQKAADLGDVHWVLAGGLTADNVSRAIRLTGARGVDTASGVESAPGVKDAKKVVAFAENAREEFQR